MILALFPGHHGKDPGAIDQDGAGDKLYSVESAITAGIVSKMALYCKLLDIPHAIGFGDWRDRLALTAHCTVGIDVHCDISTDPKVHGYHVIYYPDSVDGKRLAGYVDLALGISQHRARAPHAEDLFILRKTKFPTVLVECGFLSNSEDEQQLHTECLQYQLAWGMLQGIQEWAYGANRSL